MSKQPLTPFHLSVEKYQELLDTNMVNQLWENAPQNISVFRTEQNRHNANSEVFDLIYHITEMSGADPAVIYEIFEEHRERIIETLGWFDTSLLDKESILDNLSED
jgi:hypothetical protein